MSLTAFNRRRRELAAKAMEQEKQAAAAPSSDGPKDMGDMTVTELKRYASENGIDLGDARKKAEILAIIQAAQGAPGVIPNDGEDNDLNGSDYPGDDGDPDSGLDKDDADNENGQDGNDDGGD